MRRCAALFLPWLLIVGACSSGPPLRTFVLAPALEPVTSAPTLPASAERIVVRRVLLPDYLDTTDLLVRTGSLEVKASDTGHWGERLSQGLTHALLADLAVRLPADHLVLDKSSTADRQLLINVNALDLWPDGRCALAATWTIVDHDAPLAIVTGGGTFESPSSAGELGTGTGDERLVDALAQTVGKLADAIALKMPPFSQQSNLASQ